MLFYLKFIFFHFWGDFIRQIALANEEYDKTPDTVHAPALVLFPGAQKFLHNLIYILLNGSCCIHHKAIEGNYHAACNSFYSIGC